MTAKEAARWFKYQLDHHFEIGLLTEYELVMLDIMCKALLKSKRK